MASSIILNLHKLRDQISGEEEKWKKINVFDSFGEKSVEREMVSKSEREKLKNNNKKKG
jgi:hypothetical protein